MKLTTLLGLEAISKQSHDFPELILKKIGKIETNTNHTNSEIFKEIYSVYADRYYPAEGCFLFYGKTRNSIDEIRLVISDNYAIGFDKGGWLSVNSIETRPDLLACVYIDSENI
jgi:hypothetical protein